MPRTSWIKCFDDLLTDTEERECPGAYISDDRKEILYTDVTQDELPIYLDSAKNLDCRCSYLLVDDTYNVTLKK